MAKTAQILVGTASWTDPTLIKSKLFYPRGCSSADQRLRFYASRFPIAEVNSSYYSLPTEANSMLWAERTPEDFVFHVKSFRLFTGHQTPVEALPEHVRPAFAPKTGKQTVYYKDTPPEVRDELWRLFMEGVKPLRDAGKLGAIHFQFAPWVFYGRAGFSLVEECRERLPEDTLATEFRHASWFTDEHRDKTLTFERKNNLAHVIVDAPKVDTKNTVPAIWEVTNPALAVVRLHGRNVATWNIDSKVASDRFNYDYSDDELSEIAQDVKTLTKKVKRVAVVFNNNYQDQGQRNATTLTRLLS